MEQKRGRGKERGNKKGRGNKNFKKGGKLDQGVGALKREGGGGGWNPLTNYGVKTSIKKAVVEKKALRRNNIFTKSNIENDQSGGKLLVLPLCFI